MVFRNIFPLISWNSGTFFSAAPLILSHTQHQTLNNYSFVFASRACGPIVLIPPLSLVKVMAVLCPVPYPLTLCGISVFKSLLLPLQHWADICLFLTSTHVP